MSMPLGDPRARLEDLAAERDNANQDVRVVTQAAPASGSASAGARTCTTCGHAVGDHRSNGAPLGHRLRYGVCLIAGCDCRKYIEEDV